MGLMLDGVWRGRVRHVLVAAALGLLVAGCGDSAPPAPPVQAAPPATTITPLSRTPADMSACTAHAEKAVLLRREIEAYAVPVAPVRVALVLAATWEFYNAPTAQDPALVSAMREVAAAIGDLDAQGQAKVPPGGTLLDLVQLDASRLKAATDAVDRACAAV